MGRRLAHAISMATNEYIPAVNLSTGIGNVWLTRRDYYPLNSPTISETYLHIFYPIPPVNVLTVTYVILSLPLLSAIRKLSWLGSLLQAAQHGLY